MSADVEVAVPAPEVAGPEPPDGRATDDQRFRVVAFVAAGLLTPQVVAQVLVVATVFPTFQNIFADMGGVMPGPTQFFVSLGPFAAVLLLGIDALIFWAFYKLARRYWIGLLFAPLFAVDAVTGVIIQALYMPMFSVITLIG